MIGMDESHEDSPIRQTLERRRLTEEAEDDASRLLAVDLDVQVHLVGHLDGAGGHLLQRGARGGLGRSQGGGGGRGGWGYVWGREWDGHTGIIGGSEPEV
jgi:hypothetical protein